MFAANAIWGLMSPIAKVVMLGGVVTPLVVTDLRVFGAMLMFWLVSLFRKPEHVAPKDLARLFVASLLAIVLNQGSFIFGVSLTSPGDASIITTSMPLWAMVLAAVFLKEPITGKKVMGIAAGACGALLLIIGSGGVSSAEDVCEMMLAGASAVEIGAANLRDPYACKKIIEALPGACEKLGVERIADLTGAAHR